MVPTWNTARTVVEVPFAAITVAEVAGTTSPVDRSAWKLPGVVTPTFLSNVKSIAWPLASSVAPVKSGDEVTPLEPGTIAASGTFVPAGSAAAVAAPADTVARTALLTWHNGVAAKPTITSLPLTVSAAPTQNAVAPGVTNPKSANGGVPAIA